MTRTWATAGIAAATLAVAALACGGGGDDSPTSPSVGGGTTGGGASSSATITIGSDGRVSPTSLTISPGTRVTFVNNSSAAHDMSSDPHPDHTDCPEIDQVGFVNAGQTKQTGNLNVVRTCGFHDHNRPSDAALMGRIIIR